MWSLVLLIIDLISKSLAPLMIGAWGVIEPVTNDRLMAGLGGSTTITARWLLFALVGGAAGVLVLCQWRGRLVPGIIPALFFAGVIGNAADRVLWGAVRDWLRMGPFVLNVADVYLLISILIITIVGLKQLWRSDRGSSQSESGPLVHSNE